LPEPPLPAEIRIYRTRVGSTNHFYNSFKFFFKVATDTPARLKLRVTLRLDGDANTHVLEGSIAENLPSFDGRPVVCKVDAVAVKVVCDNVGTLKFGMEYHMTARVSFL
jgi:hypothetical protein